MAVMLCSILRWSKRSKQWSVLSVSKINTHLRVKTRDIVHNIHAIRLGVNCNEASTRKIETNGDLLARECGFVWSEVPVMLIPVRPSQVLNCDILKHTFKNNCMHVWAYLLFVCRQLTKYLFHQLTQKSKGRCTAMAHSRQLLVVK